MARINLLPWRQKLRKQRQVQFMAMLAAMVVITGVTMLGVHMYQADRIDYQNKRLAYIDKRVHELDSKITQIKSIDQTRINLEKRIQKVRDLERNRAEVVHLFHEVADRLPKGSYLTQMQQVKSNVVLKGVAQDNNEISRYILNLEKSTWLKNVGLDIITNKELGTGVISEFAVTATQEQLEPIVDTNKRHNNSTIPKNAVKR